MAVKRTGGTKTVGVILYGLVAGFAGFTVVALGQILLAFFGVWIFHRLGWEQASNSTAYFGFYYVVFIPIGLIVGMIICWRVWSNGFRNASGNPSSDKSS